MGCSGERANITCNMSGTVLKWFWTWPNSSIENTITIVDSQFVTKMNNSDQFERVPDWIIMLRSNSTTFKLATIQFTLSEEQNGSNISCGNQDWIVVINGESISVNCLKSV